MRRNILALFLTMITAREGFAQHFRMRAFYVTKDSAFEIYKHGATDERPHDGLYLAVIDSPYRIHYISETQNGLQNGIYFEFYFPTGMPKIIGQYKDNEKWGEWYFWNEKGTLIKRELWKNGKRVKILE